MRMDWMRLNKLNIFDVITHPTRLSKLSAFEKLKYVMFYGLLMGIFVLGGWNFYPCLKQQDPLSHWSFPSWIFVDFHGWIFVDFHVKCWTNL